MEYYFKQIAVFCKYNTILISKKVNLKKGNIVYSIYIMGQSGRETYRQTDGYILTLIYWIGR